MKATDVLLRTIASMTHSEVRNYVLPGLGSFLIGGVEGKGQVRLLSSDRDSREWVTPHSHRFDFACLVLDGWVENILFLEGFGERPNRYGRGTLHPVAGGLGRYELVREDKPVAFGEAATVYKAGEVYSMSASQIHSIRFGVGARVLFFEGPNVKDYSSILEPYSEGKTVPTFVTAPWMFEGAPLPISTASAIEDDHAKR